MKKIACICLVICLCLTLFGCDFKNNEETPTPTDSPADITPADSSASSPDGQKSSTPAESASDTPSSTPESTPLEDNCPDDPPGKFEKLPDLVPGEYETITGDYSVRGTVTGKIAPGVFGLSLSYPSDRNGWGKFVYVVSEQVTLRSGYVIKVNFKSADRPNDDADYVRVYADKITIEDVGEVPATKPIIYFYSPTEIVCSVKLTLNGKLTCTYPDHGENGWQSFTVRTDGTLVFPNGREYYALYWEGMQRTEWDFSKGFCVRGEDTAEFLEWALDKIGLNAREANEFIIYWLPLMQENAYNVISFQTSAYTDGAVLDIEPAPDSLLRVFMAYYPSDTEVDIEPQTFEGFTRRGFTVVEWGGGWTEKP